MKKQRVSIIGAAIGKGIGAVMGIAFGYAIEKYKKEESESNE